MSTNNMNAKHTPLILVDDEDEDALLIATQERIDNDMGEIASVSIGYNEPFESEQRMYASEMVRRFNAHDALIAALNEALEYFEDREDVVDGDYGIPAPNKEMLLASLLRMHLEAAEEPK